MRRVPDLVLGALLATAFWAGVFLWQSQKSIPNNQASPAKAEQQNVVGREERPYAITSEQHGNQKQEGKWYQTFLDHTPDWFVAIFTGLLSYVTFRLVRSTDKLWKTAESDTRILQRAYINVEPAGVHAIRPAQGKSVGHIQIVNAGKLLAKDVSWIIYHKPSQDHRLNDFPLDESSAEGEVILTPGGKMTQGGGIIYSDTELALPVGWYLYIWGAVYYKDGFDQPRATRFCHRYNCVNVQSSLDDILAGNVPKFISKEHARIHRYGNDAT